MTEEPLNAAPRVLEASKLPQREKTPTETLSPDFEALAELSPFALTPEIIDSSPKRSENVDAQEIYDLISTISDPEHPLTLGQLAVVNLDGITLTDSGNPNEIAEVLIFITPTITHCSLATLIGLGIRVRLERCLPARFRIKLKVTPGSHQSEYQVNKQLNDKERVAAACENEQLLKVIGQMLATCV